MPGRFSDSLDSICYEYEEGDTLEGLATLLNINASVLRQEFSFATLEAGTVLKIGSLSTGVDAQITDTLLPGPARCGGLCLPFSPTDQDYKNSWLARYGRDDGMIPDPRQMPIMRWIFGARMVNYNDVPTEDYQQGFIRFEPGLPGGVGIGMVKKADIRWIDYIVKELQLSLAQRELLHEAITGQNLTKEEIKAIAKEIKEAFPNK